MLGGFALKNFYRKKYIDLFWIPYMIYCTLPILSRHILSYNAYNLHWSVDGWDLTERKKYE